LHRNVLSSDAFVIGAIGVAESAWRNRLGATDVALSA
jgi:hypothetical protein